MKRLLLFIVFLLTPLAAHGQTISLVADSSSTVACTNGVCTTASAATFTCTITNAVAAGDLVWMAFKFGANRTFVSATDSIGGNTYFQGTGFFGDEHGSVYSVLTNGTAVAIVITVTIGGGNSGGATAVCGAFNSSTGWPTGSGAVDVIAPTGTATSAAAATGTLTTTGDVRLILSFLGLGNPRTVTKDTGFSDLAVPATTNIAQHAQYRVTSAAFNETVDFTLSSSTSWFILADSFKPNAPAATAKPRSPVIIQ